MNREDISPDLRATLSRTSAASISTQLIRRGLRNVAIRGVKPLRADLPP